MPLPEAVRAHYLAQLRQAEAAVILASRVWRGMDADDLDGSWPATASRLTAIVTAAQVGAAAAGATYVQRTLEELNQVTDAAGEVVAARFGGVASDGRDLSSLLYSAVVHVKLGRGSGMLPLQALGVGRRSVEMITRTQVADAGRGAESVAIAARPGIGYTRMVSPPCCQRCAVQAGRWFRWNEGFLRHPRCDCRHVPTGEADAGGLVATIDPSQIRDLTRAQRKAIGEGADLNQVINAHRRGTRSKDGMTTSEGTTRRGVAGQRGARRRLTPEAIYRVSSTRDEALTRLRDNGYLL